jgi:2-hydroxy-6-oxonona-2,4-dienedioate hydrolase
MVLGKLIRLISAAASAAGIITYVRYRRDVSRIRTALAGGSKMASTKAGLIEYAETGRGEPLLMVHGAGGGYDQGLLLGKDFGESNRVIAPSRFGYLKDPGPS